MSWLWVASLEVCPVNRETFNISAIYWAILMKPMSFNQKFYIDYIYITFKSATPLLMGVVLGGCGTQELRTSFKYLSQLLTDLDETNGIQSEIFHGLHIYSFWKCHTPSRGRGTWWVWHLRALYLIFLSQSIINQFEWYLIFNII